MVTPIRVAVIDDDKSVRTSLGRLLKAAGVEIVSFPSAREFLEDPARDQVDCALTDVRMPGVDGFKLQQMLSQSVPYLSVVFISGHGDIPMTVRAILGGAVDFLEKPVDDGALLEAIRRAAERTRDQKKAGAELSDLQRRYQLLTPRERQVFKLVTAGLINKRAGVDLGISERTIKAHRARVMFKLKAESLAELVRIAEQLQV